MAEDWASSDRQRQAEEGGGSSPPSSAAPDRGQERPPVIQADAIEALAEVLPEGDRARSLQIARTLLGWSGPLPPAGELREYNDLSPSILDAIIKDFERRSEIYDATARHDMEVEDRQLNLMENEQKLREKESEEDGETRAWAQRFSAFITILLVLAAIIVLLFAPIDSDWARVAAAGILFAPIVIIAAIMALRGRYGAEEGQVMREVMPKVAEANRKERKRTQDESPSQLPDTVE
jgi:uncharacterized membrane protein